MSRLFSGCFSRCFGGGICSSGAVESMRAIISLCSGLLGTMPCAPLFSALRARSRLVSTRPPFESSGPWHSRQCSASSGCTSREKSTGAADSTAGSRKTGVRRVRFTRNKRPARARLCGESSDGLSGPPVRRQWPARCARASSQKCARASRCHLRRVDRPA